jgi:hypothetical protein
VDWELLDGIYSVLEVSLIQMHPLFIQLAVQVPHEVQQVMSGESMPVLSGAVPSFEIFMTRWEKLRAKFPLLKPWIDVGLQWAEKYYKRMDDTDAYVIAMCELLPSSLYNLNVN